MSEIEDGRCPDCFTEISAPTWEQLAAATTERDAALAVVERVRGWKAGRELLTSLHEILEGARNEQPSRPTHLLN